jgi:peptide/nickel transport system permease protein
MAISAGEGKVAESTAFEELVLPASKGRLERAHSFLRRLLRIRLAGLGLAVVVALIFVALAADYISPYDPLEQNYDIILQGPSLAHPMGVDHLGRDVLARVIYGSRVSLMVGIISVGLATGAGIVIGLLAGYSSGTVGEVLMRLMDAIYSFPAVMLALAITAALGPGIMNAMVAIGIVYIPIFARLARAQALSVREMDFVTAARATGVEPFRIVVRHIWPNITAPIIVQASLLVSLAIIVEASLSFLGLGVQPPTPTWGSMLREGYGYMERAPWLSFFPGLAIFITVLGLNFLGDGLRMALDPKLWQRGQG